MLYRASGARAKGGRLFSRPHGATVNGGAIGSVAPASNKPLGLRGHGRSERDPALSGATRLPSRITRPGGNGARGRVSPTARPAKPVNAQLAASLTPAEPIRVMMAKDFISAKTFHAYSANFFRRNKSLRDRGGPPRRPMLSAVT